MTSKSGFKMGLRRPPYAFTRRRYGVAMLSGILNSKRAIAVNIGIIRAFIELRRVIAADRDLARTIVEHERKIAGLTNDVRQILNLIHPLLDGPVKKVDQIGFKGQKQPLSTKT